MDKVITYLTIWFAIIGCKADREEVIVSQYSFGKHLVLKDELYLTIEQSDEHIKYTFFDDSSKLRVAPTFKIPNSTDTIIYLEDEELKLIYKKQFQIADSTYEVLKYEDSLRETTLFFNKQYGPILWRGNHYKGHQTYDRPKRIQRRLIDIIRNDSLNFGGI